MTAVGCDRLTFEALTDYAAGDVPEPEAAAIEEHLFSCAACAGRVAALDTLLGAVGPAVRSAAIDGPVTDAILNRLAREGVRVRTFTLTPGAVVPCAVWDDDEVMALRLRGDFGDATEITMSRRVGGVEVVRTTTELGPGERREILHAEPAARIRELPEVEVEILLTARQGDDEREIARYTLVHGGSLRRG